MMDTSQMELIPLLETLNHKEYDLVELDKKTIDRVKLYTYETFNEYKTNGRDDKKKKLDIFYGKIAEFAFKQKFGSQVDEVYMGDGPDKGFDFIFLDTWKKIDVKFFGFESHHVLVPVYKKSKSDLYAAFRKIYSSNEKIILDFYGFCDTSFPIDLKIMKTYQNNKMLYIDCKFFKDLEIC